jgi:hypothetical protein
MMDNLQSHGSSSTYPDPDCVYPQAKQRTESVDSSKPFALPRRRVDLPRRPITGHLN